MTGPPSGGQPDNREVPTYLAGPQAPAPLTKNNFDSGVCEKKADTLPWAFVYETPLATP